MILAFFLNAAIDQQCEKKIKELGLEKDLKRIISEKYNSEELPKYIGANGKPGHPIEILKQAKGNIKQSESKVAPLWGDLEGALEGAGALPIGNNGLGLALLGLSGDEILPPDIYNQCRQTALQQVPPCRPGASPAQASAPSWT